MRYIALLRGINVGGNTMMKMEELLAMFEALRFENVVSYINSGNLAFDVTSPSVSKGTTQNAEIELVTRIEAVVENHLGKPVWVMIREQGHIERVLANNPFAGQFASHKEMHVLFLRSEMSEEQIALLSELTPSAERFGVIGREVYCHLPMGVADSYIGRGQFERKLKVTVTARNWRTVQKLAEL
jgi:uncharacterized protein (DUF1697 family)